MRYQPLGRTGLFLGTLAASLFGCGDAAEVTPTDLGAEVAAEVAGDATGDVPEDGIVLDAAADVGPELPSDVEDAGPDVPPPAPREPGARSPRTAACDDADPTLCLLPWPSNVFTAPDPATATGVRLAVDGTSLPPGDPVTPLLRADGFSRVSPLVTGFPGPLDPASLEGPDGPPLRVLVAEGLRLGEAEPVHCRTFEGDEAPHATALVCYPHRPLAPATEHLAVVLNDVAPATGAPFEADRTAALALGLAAPETPAEAALHAYHAPARAALAAAGVDPAKVLRLWDFTTRSAEDPRADLRALRAAHVAAVKAGEVGVAVDAIDYPPHPNIAVVVRGRLTGLPSFVVPGGALSRDASGAPVASGVHDVPFRALVPAGEGDYPVVAYAHGTGGNVRDGSFDGLMAEHHTMKLSLEIDGWTDTTLGDTMERLLSPIGGSDAVAARVLESLAGGSALLAALDGPLGDLVSAPTLGDAPNPAAGRRPDTAIPLWAGGSLGGTVGLVFGHLEPAIRGGVLNVPGAGFTHWLPASDLYWLLEGALGGTYAPPLELQLVTAMAQTLFDAMDGAAWVGASPTNPIFLVQISVGDPVLPNVGSDLVATSLDAVHVGAPLYPLVGLELADEALGRSAVTQFEVASDDALDVHGFAAGDSPAGQAARQQLIDFVDTLRAGVPRVAVPDLCAANTPAGSCDFSAVTD